MNVQNGEWYSHSHRGNGGKQGGGESAQAKIHCKNQNLFDVFFVSFESSVGEVSLTTSLSTGSSARLVGVDVPTLGPSKSYEWVLKRSGRIFLRLARNTPRVNETTGDWEHALISEEVTLDGVLGVEVLGVDGVAGLSEKNGGGIGLIPLSRSRRTAFAYLEPSPWPLWVGVAGLVLGVASRPFVLPLASFPFTCCSMAQSVRHRWRESVTVG